MSGDKQKTQYRAVITGVVVDNSVYGNMVIGDTKEYVVGPYATLPAVKTGIRRARRDWPFNEQAHVPSGYAPVKFTGVKFEEAELTWKEINV